ncbi:hypothetical protein MTR67_024146 [Solanum verrucosum]|uniref:Uncharacterized protein n=1 Tax=Solanum verrucosum TaxID=315347 RepID=A0AAF0R2E4_SOLVR|nr:hypothetical protein MTR67_024146 [Solanum verrucosum]
MQKCSMSTKLRGIWFEEQSMDTNEQKGTRQLKEQRKEGLMIRLTHWASHRLAMISPKVPVRQALKEKIKWAIERSSRHVAERFRDAVLDRPKL